MLQKHVQAKLEIPRNAEIRTTITVLKSKRRVSDARFDVIYPEQIQKLSSTHWTPVRVARRASELLAEAPNSRILDIGSGAGKFCLIAALSSPATFVGIEQRGNLVELSQKIAKRYNIENAQFILGNMQNVDWSDFSAFYLYNPFIENIYAVTDRIDSAVEQTKVHYKQYIRFVQMKLDLAPVGTRVATYHGFGGRMPAGYVHKLREPIASDKLDLWVKE